MNVRVWLGDWGYLVLIAGLLVVMGVQYYFIQGDDNMHVADCLRLKPSWAETSTATFQATQQREPMCYFQKGECTAAMIRECDSNTYRKERWFIKNHELTTLLDFSDVYNPTS